MKKTFWLFLPFAAVAFLIYYLWKKAAAAKAAAQPTQTTTSTAGVISQFFPGWAGFTSASLTNAAKYTTGATNLLTQVSNAFGVNNGGNNPGVSTGGSAAGGVASSGSGAGVPGTLSQTAQNIWSTAFNFGKYTTAPLNNFDVVSAAPPTVASSNPVKTTTGNKFWGWL